MRLDSLKLKIHNVTENNVQVKNVAEIKNQTATLAVGQKVHFDCTPSLNGVEYPGQSEEVRSWKKEDGTSPIVEYRWFAAERELSNSGNDPFHLGSYEDNDNGFTPTLKLTEQIGPGSNVVKMYAFVDGKYNDGVYVESEPVYFRAD